jgi:hypothetical protein
MVSRLKRTEKDMTSNSINPPPSDPKHELMAWYCAEYDKRTKAVEEGVAPIDWAVPEYRISWTEVVSKAEGLGILTSPLDLRLWFHEQQTKGGASVFQIGQ